jgi:hypothetical protein
MEVTGRQVRAVWGWPNTFRMEHGESRTVPAATQGSTNTLMGVKWGGGGVSFGNCWQQVSEITTAALRVGSDFGVLEGTE